MANTLSAKKRNRQNESHRRRNRWRLREMRLAIRDLREKLLHGSVKEAEECLQKTCGIIDKSASKGVIHRNNASRKKSRLTARVKAKKAAA